MSPNIQCGEVINGIPDRAEGWVFIACEGHLVFVGDTGDATVLRAPTYVPQLPDEQEVAQREEELKAFNRGLGVPESMNLEEALERYRTTPKNYHLSTAQQLFDAANRYWIATQRDLREWSYLDVYEHASYVCRSVNGSRRSAQGHTMSWGRRSSSWSTGSFVGVDDADLVPDRPLDWYEIGELRR